MATNTTLQKNDFSKGPVWRCIVAQAVPHLGFGVNGVFLAEPISNVIGGTASYVTMMLTAYRRLGDKSQEST